jgi:RNA polymerase sigma factor (sigma-70 family)
MQVDTIHKILPYPHPDEVSMTPSPIDDKLWHDFKGGCRAAFALIYKNHFFNLYQYGIQRGYAQETVKDCIQDLFVELWKYRENLKNTDAIAYYLLKSLRYKLSHHARTKPIPEQDDLSINTLSIEDKLIEEQTLFQHKKKVLEALNVLTQRQQQAIQLKFFQNLKNEEIAKCMSISVPAVYNLVSKALVALKENLGKAYLLILIEFIL